MGVDGHIAYFDAKIAEKILSEIKAKYPNDTVYTRCYQCLYTVNGKHVWLSYWGDNTGWCGWGAEASLLDSWDPENNVAQKEFAKRMASEALIIEDQEVWA